MNNTAASTSTIEPRGRTCATRYSRLRIAIKGLVLLYVLVIGLSLTRSPHLVDFFGNDFLTFWAASHLALAGKATAAFDPNQLRSAAQIALPDFDQPLLWHYPPTFQLIALPLALSPYLVASIAWLGVTLFAYLAAMRCLVSHRDLMLIVIAFPAVVVNLRIGQNGFLSAALFAGALALLRDRPVLAGILTGLLSYKPHLGVLIPIALLCARQWTAFFAACATTAAFAAASAAALGWETWAAFFNTIPNIGGRLDGGALKWRIIPSVYIGLRVAGVDPVIAYTAHAAVAALAALAVAWAWLRRIPFELAAAVLVCAAVLVPPYIFDYDLTLLAIPIMILVADGTRRGWLAGERPVLVLAWFSPILHMLHLQQYGVSLGPLCLIALLAIVLRRAYVFADAHGTNAYDRRLPSAQQQAAPS